MKFTLSPQKRKRFNAQRLGEILLGREVLREPSHLEEALAHQRHHGGRLGQVLTELGFVTEQDMERELASALSIQYGFPYLNLEHCEVDSETLGLVPKEVAQRYQFLPIERIGNSLTVAMADPLNLEAMKELKRLTHCSIQQVITTPTEIREAIERAYRKPQPVAQAPAEPCVASARPGERRAMHRIPAHLPLRLIHRRQTLCTHTKDLSLSALSCTLEEQFSSPVTSLQVCLELPRHPQPTTIVCQGTVVRMEVSNLSESALRYTLAMTFNGMDDHGRRAIAEFAASQGGHETDGRVRTARWMRQGQGLFMLFAMQVVAVLALLMSTLMMRSLHENGTSVFSRSQQQAFELAEAALDHSIDLIRVPNVANAPNYGDVPSTSLNGGQYRSQVFDSSEEPTLSLTQRRIIGHGEQNGSSREVEALVALTAVGPFGGPLVGDEQVVVRGDVKTDSYDSRDGAYGDPVLDADGNQVYDANGNPLTNQGSDGDIATNSTTAAGIDIGGSVEVAGQLLVGTGSDPNTVVEFHGTAMTVTADPDATTLSAPLPLPPVVIPDDCPATDLTVGDGQIVELSAGNHCYRRVRVNGGGVLTWDASGPVRVFITESFTANGNTVIGVETAPTQMIFMLASINEATVPDATITGTSQFYGGFYAPNATVAIRGTAEIYGSLVANRIVVTGTADVHYDEAMREVKEPIVEYQTKVFFWRDRDATEGGA